MPPTWQPFADNILTSETVFEQESLPDALSVIGAGVVGLELGQALSRLGIEVEMFHGKALLSILTDPEVNQVALELFRREFPLYTDHYAEVSEHSGQLLTQAGDNRFTSEKLLAALGRRPNLQGLNLECLNVPQDDHGIPEFDPRTMQVGDQRVFIAGDANTVRPLLHEAADEGRIAGFNATQTTVHCFERRVPMGIVFTDPNIAVVGQSYAQLQDQNPIIGRVDFSNQGRARINQANKGVLHVYADRSSGGLLGAEMIAPSAEHMAHLLAWGIQRQQSVFDLLQMPFYHPVVEEGMRSALRDAARQIKSSRGLEELVLCASRSVV